MRSQFTFKFIGVALSVLTHMVSTASAQWTAVNLHPSGGFGGKAWGAQGGQQAGVAFVDGNYRASLWSGTAASWLNLNPTVASASEAYGMGGGQQVGRITVGGGYQASLWSGTAASWVGLHPISAISSEAHATDGVQQVGWVRDAVSIYRASLWTGSSGSLVDLHPAGAIYSEARGVDGGQQVGFASLGGAYHACLWTGSAASMVDLTPVGATSALAYAVHDGQQVGQALFEFDFIGRASLWSGSADTWVNLHPFPGDGNSIAFGVYGGKQVGAVSWSGGGSGPHASVWSGTAASWVDLQAFLPAEFTDSVARGISGGAGFTYVVGYAYNSVTFRDEPVMWLMGPPPCPADVNGDATVNVDDLLAVIGAWGSCPRPCPPSCAADIAPEGGNCTVNVDDLLAVIGAWGPCP